MYKIDYRYETSRNIIHIINLVASISPFPTATNIFSFSKAKYIWNLKYLSLYFTSSSSFWMMYVSFFIR